MASSQLIASNFPLCSKDQVRDLLARSPNAYLLKPSNAFEPQPGDVYISRSPLEADGFRWEYIDTDEHGFTIFQCGSPCLMKRELVYEDTWYLRGYSSDDWSLLDSIDQNSYSGSCPSATLYRKIMSLSYNQRMDFRFLLYLTGLRCLRPDQYDTFLNQPRHMVFPRILHDVALLQQKMDATKVLDGVSTSDAQRQALALLQEYICFAERTLVKYRESHFSTVQNEALLLICLGFAQMPHFVSGSFVGRAQEALIHQLVASRPEFQTHCRALVHRFNDWPSPIRRDPLMIPTEFDNIWVYACGMWKCELLLKIWRFLETFPDSLNSASSVIYIYCCLEIEESPEGITLLSVINQWNRTAAGSFFHQTLDDTFQQTCTVAETCLWLAAGPLRWGIQNSILKWPPIDRRTLGIGIADYLEGCTPSALEPTEEKIKASLQGNIQERAWMFDTNCAAYLRSLDPAHKDQIAFLSSFLDQVCPWRPPKDPPGCGWLVHLYRLKNLGSNLDSAWERSQASNGTNNQKGNASTQKEPVELDLIRDRLMQIGL